MQTRLGISSVVLVLSTALSVQTTTACPAGIRRGRSGTVDHGLCRKQSRHDHGTLFQGRGVVGHASPTLRSDPAALRTYFVGAFQALPKATVKFGDQLIRVYGDTAVNTGYYTFSYTKDGETISIPAR